MKDSKARSTDKLSRRNALRMLGLTAAVGYTAPMALMVSGSPAEAWERSRRFRHRTDRFRHRTHRFHHRTDRFSFRERTRRFW